jgi:hypothetical protein
MNTAHLIAQLLEIEQAIGKLEPARIRSMVFEAEETVLDLEKQMIDILLESESVQLLMDFSRRTSPLSEMPVARTPEKFLVN